MKKMLCGFLSFVFLFGLTLPGVTKAIAEESKLPGKIAIISSDISWVDENFYSAQEVMRKYGQDNVIHVSWPKNFFEEQEEMVSLVNKLADDPDIKVLIINEAVPGTNAAVDKLFEKRDDVFIIYCTPQEDPAEVSKRADMILMVDELYMGYIIPVQAKKLGAKSLVHYSFPRHMSVPILSARRELMRETCAEIGIEFIDATIYDPYGEIGVAGAQEFIMEDVFKMVEQYGEETAFFCTNCTLQPALIFACAETGAIYPQPCCPSPFHGFPDAFVIETGDYSKGDAVRVLSETENILTQKGVLGRFSTWPVSAPAMFTNAAADYGVKWMNGEVPKAGIDSSVLNTLMADYAGVDVGIKTYYDSNGKPYKNFLLVTEDYFTYGDPLPDIPPSAPIIPSSMTIIPASVVLNEKLNFKLPILIRNDRTFYPMREFFETLGAKVSWDESKRTASGALNEDTVEFVIDTNKYYVNGKEKLMDDGVNSFIENGRTYVPIRFAAEGLGYKVEWDKQTNTVIISK